MTHRRAAEAAGRLGAFNISVAFKALQGMLARFADSIGAIKVPPGCRLETAEDGKMVLTVDAPASYVMVELGDSPDL